MLFGGNEYKSNTFIADTKKINPRCIKTDFIIARKIGEVLIESVFIGECKFDYLVVY